MTTRNCVPSYAYFEGYGLTEDFNGRANLDVEAAAAWQRQVAEKGLGGGGGG